MNKQVKIITYNIDGLPESLDLNDLPFILKPIAWIYKLIKKTTLVKINDNKNVCLNTQLISKYLSLNNPDIICVQEDFNYHKELVDNFYDRYDCGTYTGGFDISKLFSSVKFFPKPRFKADGLNLIYKLNTIKSNREHIVAWNKSNGYINNANDELTTKGFRFYNLTLYDKYVLDLYIVHMDADFYDPINCPNVQKDIEARQSQFKQLSNYILERYNKGIDNPILIVGDTNSYDKYEWDVNNIQSFIESFNKTEELHCEEIPPRNYNDCDRIFYISNNKANFTLKMNDCYFDTNIYYTDHKPLIANFNIIERQ